LRITKEHTMNAKHIPAGRVSTTDRIEKSILLHAPRARVWKALTDPAEFGAWFGVNLSAYEHFTPGATMTGRITMPNYDHLMIEMLIERVQPQDLFSYRWHPYAVEPAIDYSKEPTTLVEFTLDEQDGATQLRVTESGFDRIPAARRGIAFRMNTDGWTAQLVSIERHVAQ
jgi:uncharacterized protein YndB with AHSA1/START domain